MRADGTELPWRKAGLLEVADLIRGVSYKRDEARSEPGSGLVPVLRANNVNDATLNFADLVYVPERRVSQEQRIQRGDIVLAMSSGSRDVVGKAALARDDWPGGFGAFCGVLRTRPGMEARYIARFLQSAEYRRQIDSIATGTNINNLSKTTLKSIELPIAPHEIQTRLSALLDAIEEKRGGGAAHLVAAKRAVDRLRQAVLAAACSGRLSAGWREAHLQLGPSSDELLRELRSPGGKSLDQESSAEAFDLPGTWRVATGAEAFAFVTSGSRGWAKYYSEEGPAFLRVGNLDRHRLDLDLTSVQAVTPPSSAESKRTRVQPGDLLISITAEVGMVGVVPADLGEGYVNQHVAIARPHPKLNSRFLAAFVAAPAYGEAQLDALQRGATKAGLGLDDIRALRIPLPPSEEQVEIARRVDQLMSIADGLDSRIDAASHRIDRSSHAVLAKAFRGDLVLNDVGLAAAEGLSP